jgi:hemerythrin HHE cation binding domain-containing protein
MRHHNPDAQNFVQALTRAEAAIHLHGLNDGLGDLRTLWEQHVEDTEEGVFPALIAASPTADGLVGFFLAEHADLSARLTALTECPPSGERSQASIQLIHRLIQHVFLEARVLPSADQLGTRAGVDAGVGAASAPVPAFAPHQP